MSETLTVLSGGAVRASLEPAAELYLKYTGIVLAIEYLPMGPLLRRLTPDRLPDLVVATAAVMDDAERRGVVARRTRSEVGRVAVGIAVRAGAPVPDIATPEALRATLLAAKSVVQIDPAHGTSGRHVQDLFEELGIAEAMKSRTVMGESGAVVTAVARGEAELGLHQITAMRDIADVQIVGPLPAPLGKETVYVGAASITTHRRQAVKQVLAFLRTPEIRALFAAKGFVEPANDGKCTAPPGAPPVSRG